MPFAEIPPPPSFGNQLKDIIKKYSNSEQDIKNELDDILNNPKKGDPIPAFGQMELHKLRIALKKYGIGKSKGLRLIFLVNKELKTVTKLVIYSKSDYKGEKWVTAAVIDALKEIKANQTKQITLSN